MSVPAMSHYSASRIMRQVLIAPMTPIGMSSLLEPGQFVRHPACPDWGLGQIQSVTGSRVTVNFEHAGKVLINAALVALEVVDV
jgi:hypothetical protein